LNSDYEIYRAPEESIPAEDKLRLEAYMRGRHDEEQEAKVREMKKLMQEAEAWCAPCVARKALDG
jgi:hypothetical protein